MSAPQDSGPTPGLELELGMGMGLGLSPDQHPDPKQGGFDPSLLQRVEDAGLNASAPPEQLWMDGWLVRFNPGKAQRARCINAVAPGAQNLTSERLTAKLMRCESLYQQRGLRPLFRITPFTQPPNLDAQLQALGYLHHDETLVMVGLEAIAKAQRAAAAHRLPEGLQWAALGASDFAHAIGALRGSSPAACAAHAARLLASPVPYVAWVIKATHGGPAWAAGQTACDAELVGLYDVAVAPSHQRQGLAQMLCERLLAQAAAQGAQTAYLQVGADNPVAQRMYVRMGFAKAYSYHFRLSAST